MGPGVGGGSGVSLNSGVFISRSHKGSLYAVSFRTFASAAGQLAFKLPHRSVLTFFNFRVIRTFDLAHWLILSFFGFCGFVPALDLAHWSFPPLHLHCSTLFRKLQLVF